MKVLDFIILALIVSIVTLQPHFMHGAINLWETGQYLPQINELFHGKVPYRDMFIMRGPLEIFMPAFLMKMFGIHIGMLNAYFYFGTVLTLVIYAIFALRIFSTRGFVYLFSLVLIARTFTRVTFAIWGGMRFSFGILAVLLAVNFLKRKNPIWLVLAGMVSSLAFWTSFEIGVFCLISILVMLCYVGYLENDIKLIVNKASLYIIGNLIITLPILLYLFFNNALIDYASTLRIVLFKMTDAFDSALVFETPTNLKEFLQAFSPWDHNFKYTLPFFFYAAIAIYLLRNIRRRRIELSELPIIPVLIYGIFLYKGAFRDIEGPQYRIALQPLLLIMFFYLERIYAVIRSAWQASGAVKRYLRIFLIAAIPLFCIVFSVHKYNKRFFIFKEIKSLVLNKHHLDIPYTHPEPKMITIARGRGMIVPGVQAEEIDGVVEYISSKTGYRQTLLTFPDLGAYNFLTDRPPMGRFHTAAFSFFCPEWFEEFMRELKNKKPEYIICAREFAILEQFRPTMGEYLDEVKDYLGKNYDVVMTYSSVNILKIRQ